jgi:hypothetical protein
MDIIVKVCTDPEEYDDASEGPEMAPVDTKMVAERMKALLGAGGVPRVRGMSEKQRQSELEMLITQLTGTVPEKD